MSSLRKRCSPMMGASTAAKATSSCALLHVQPHAMRSHFGTGSNPPRQVGHPRRMAAMNWYSVLRPGADCTRCTHGTKQAKTGSTHPRKASVCGEAMFSVPRALSATVRGRQMHAAASVVCSSCCQSRRLRPLHVPSQALPSSSVPSPSHRKPRLLEQQGPMGAGACLGACMEVRIGFFRLIATPEPVFCRGKVPTWAWVPSPSGLKPK